MQAQPVTLSHNAEQENPTTPKRIYTGADYLTLPRSPETWLIEPLLPRGGSLLLYGDPKVGKSFAALQMAEALATGQDWLNLFRVGSTLSDSACSPLPPTPDTYSRNSGESNTNTSSSSPKNTVVYIQLDTPRSLWAERISTLQQAGLKTDQIYFADRETLDTWPFDIRDPAHQKPLKEALTELSPDCVIIDTLRECCTGADENNSTEMQEVVAHLTAVVNPAALVIVSHAKKPVSEGHGSVINDNRGSSYITGKMDGIVRFTKTGIEVAGRAVEEADFRLERTPHGTWDLSDREIFRKKAAAVLMDPAFKSLRERAKRLAELTGKNEDACRSLLHRMSSGGVSQNSETPRDRGVSETPLSA